MASRLGSARPGLCDRGCRRGIDLPVTRLRERLFEDASSELVDLQKDSYIDSTGLAALVSAASVRRTGPACSSLHPAPHPELYG